MTYRRCYRCDSVHTITSFLKKAGSQSPAPNRIQAIDIARGLALLAMTVYHFTWDLEFFGWIAPFTIVQAGWVAFARCIAFSFLFLVGVSMVLAHRGGICWPIFVKRLAMVVAGALAITLATRIATPQTFIFFGILHAIALFSLLGLPLVTRHWIIPLTLALLVLLIDQFWSAEFFSQTALLWVGLAPVPPSSSDYVPMFPWFAAVLAGISFGIWADKTGLFQRMAGLQWSSSGWKPIILIGRNSLIFYLLHQPLMMGAMWLFTTYLFQPDRTAYFEQQCRVSCEEIRGERFCSNYCGCMVEGLKRENLFIHFYRRPLDEGENKLLNQIRDNCIATAE